MDKTLWPAASSTPYEKDINFKFFVDVANPPTLASPNPLNQYISSVVRTSQGIYTLTFTDSALLVAAFFAELSLNAAIGTYAQAGPTTGFGAPFSAATPPTAQIFILNSAGAVTDPPAANANNFVCGTIVLCDISKV
jgi:hypothetical protein